MHSIFSLAVCALQLLLHRATSIEVRLSPGPNYGRVEVQDSSGTWGTICNTYFNDNSANVVCKALGYNKGISNQGYYGNMPIIYEWIDCTGEETQLSECSPVDSKGTNCGDASVYCFNSQGPQYRLVPGPNYGRVEVGFDDVWGTMCWSYTHWQDARVLCRELGYTDGMFSNRIEAYGPGTGDIMIYRPHCNGDESRFQDCRMEKGFGAKPSACTHQHDWSVFCTVETTSTIILHSFYGRVEFWVDGTYNYRQPICDYDWDDTDATVLCKEHGFDGGKAVMHGTFNPWSYNGVKSSFQCTGNEAKLTDCPHTNGVNCPSDHNANVICYYNDWSATPTVSLSHGASYGRVRIMYYKVNGLLCDSDFTTEDATVVCKMKNYDSAIGYKNGGFGIEGGHVPFWMQNLVCTGSESTILPGGGCSSNHYGGFYPTCRYNYGGVGVVCYNSGASYSYSVRLANGKSNYGRLQVNQYNVWGSVADVLRTSGNVAVVACKELGFDDGMPFYGNPLGKPTSAIFFYNIQCNGDEASLADCTYDSFDNANTWTHNYDLVVQCFDANSPVEINYKLDNHISSNPSYGRIHVEYRGMWGLVCSDEFDDNDAKVVCRSLGYQYGRKQPRTYQRHIPMLMTKVNCTGTEESLDQCDFPGFGAVDPSTCSLYSYYTPASVVCYNNTEPEDVEYRIANGGLVNGRLELSIDQRWGTMCRHSANNAHASIACKRLGFADGIMQNYKYGPGDLSSPIWLRCYSDCDKEELTQCDKKYGIGMTHCNRNHLDDLGIFCNSSANDAVCGKVVKKIGQHFGEFRTPGYPVSDYPVSCKVLWMIVVPHGFRVSLYISEIKLQASDKCTWKDATDILEVLDASLVKSWQAVRNMKVLGRFCGESNPTPMKTMGNRMLVKFRSDKTTTAVGFSAYYQSECDGAAAWMRDGTVSSIEGTDIMKRPSENVKHCQRLCDSQQFCQELYFDQDTKTCYTKLKAFVGKNVIVNGASLQFFKKQCINCNGHYSSILGKGMAGETLLVLTATKEECISHCRRRPSCESVTHTTENTCKLYTFSSMSNPDNVVGTPSTNLYNLLCKVESGSAKSCAHLNNRVRKSGWYRINAGSKQISVFCHMNKYGGGWTLLLATKAKSCNTPTPILSEFERTQKLDKEYSILDYNKILREQSDTDYTKYLVEVVSENINWKSSWIVPVDYDSNSDNNIELSKHINADEATLTRTKEALQALNNGSVIQDNSNFYFGEDCNNPVTDSGDKMTIFLWIKNIKGQRVQCGYNICKYGGVCSYKNGQRECKCPAGFSGDRCQIVASRRRKIGTQFHKYQNKLFNTNHVSKSLSDASEMECMQECLSKSSCMAFNYKKPDNGQVNCHVIETNVAGRRKDHDNHWHMYKRLPEGVLDTEEDEL